MLTDTLTLDLTQKLALVRALQIAMDESTVSARPKLVDHEIVALEELAVKLLGPPLNGD